MSHYVCDLPDIAHSYFVIFPLTYKLYLDYNLLHKGYKGRTVKLAVP